MHWQGVMPSGSVFLMAHVLSGGRKHNADHLVQALTREIMSVVETLGRPIVVYGLTHKLLAQALRKVGRQGFTGILLTAEWRGPLSLKTVLLTLEMVGRVFFRRSADSDRRKRPPGSVSKIITKLFRCFRATLTVVGKPVHVLVILGPPDFLDELPYPPDDVPNWREPFRRKEKGARHAQDQGRQADGGKVGQSGG